MNFVRPEKASEKDLIKLGTKEWNDAVKDIPSPGKSKDYRTKDKKDADSLLEEGRPKLPTNDTYDNKGGDKHGKEYHPNEKDSENASHNDLPHIKWWDFR